MLRKYKFFPVFFFKISCFSVFLDWPIVASNVRKKNCLHTMNQESEQLNSIHTNAFTLHNMNFMSDCKWMHCTRMLKESFVKLAARVIFIFIPFCIVGQLFSLLSRCGVFDEKWWYLFREKSVRCPCNSVVNTKRTLSSHFDKIPCTIRLLNCMDHYISCIVGIHTVAYYMQMNLKSWKLFIASATLVRHFSRLRLIKMSNECVKGDKWCEYCFRLALYPLNVYTCCLALHITTWYQWFTNNSCLRISFVCSFIFRMSWFW